MSDWFYYDANGRKIGPVDTATLRMQAKKGVIQRETILENVSGQRGQAGTIKGLEFVEIPPTAVPLPTINTQIPSEQTNLCHHDSIQTNVVDWRYWQKGTWTIVAAAGLAILSFILPWKDIGFITVSGFRLGTFLLAVLYIYPVLTSVSNRHLNSIAGYSCAAVGIILAVVFYCQCSLQLFDIKSNIAGTGVYTFIGACVVLAVGIFLYHPAEIAVEHL